MPDWNLKKRNKKCTCCESNNTSKTQKQYLDSMRDYFCDDCGKDFTPIKTKV